MPNTDEDKAEYVFTEDTEGKFTKEVLDKGLFKKETLHAKDIEDGVSLTIGELKSSSPGEPSVQSVMFDMDKYDKKSAIEWIKAHDLFSEKKTLSLNSIDGVEIFAAGKWNGDKYTIEDLQQMVSAYNETKDKLKPVLKLGHNGEQKLIQKDGLPSAGIISNLYVKGEKLIADFSEIPSKIFDLLKKKAYKKVSSEIYWNIDINGKKHKHLLSAVALLGTEMPAVTCLNDILALYGINGIIKTYNQNENAKTYSYEGIENMEKEQLEQEVKAYKADLEKTEQELTEKLAKIEEQEKELKESCEKIKDFEAKVFNAEVDRFMDGLEKETLMYPSMRVYVKELLGEEKKEYSIKDKKYSKMELLKNILNLYSKSDVNFEENSDGGEVDAKNEDALIEKVEKYALEHKVTFSDAYKTLAKK